MADNIITVWGRNDDATTKTALFLLNEHVPFQVLIIDEPQYEGMRSYFENEGNDVYPLTELNGALVVGFDEKGLKDLSDKMRELPQ